jgi:hypothetical protein
MYIMPTLARGLAVGRCITLATQPNHKMPLHIFVAYTVPTTITRNYGMIKFIESFIFLLAVPTIPLIVLKLLGTISLTWLGVFTPFLILLSWCVGRVIAAGIASGMAAVKEQKQRSKND